MTYAQAKSVVYEEGCTDWRRMRAAAAVLLRRLDATSEDIADAEWLARCAVTMQCKELKR